jgi:hypothetical protein
MWNLEKFRFHIIFYLLSNRISHKRSTLVYFYRFQLLEILCNFIGKSPAIGKPAHSTTVVRNAKTTVVVQVSAFSQFRLALFLHKSRNTNDFFR